MARPTPPPTGYRLLSLLLLPLWLVHAAWQAWQYRCADYFWQRAGRRFNPCPNNSQIWLHAASVGEVALIRPLVEQLIHQAPLVVSCFTITGFLQARKTLPEEVVVVALPIDSRPMTRRFIRQCNFRLALIAETELWPETLYQARSHGIPLLQINARLSHKSLSTSGWSRALLKRTLGYFERFLVRNEQDIKNLYSMGVAAQRITLCGNLKYASSDHSEQAVANLIERPYLLFASTHAPEERLFAEIYHQLDSPPLFVIAPRHPRRCHDIVQALQPLGLNIRLRSRGQLPDASTQVYIADTLGEMQPLMAHALVVIMGGSFNETGGHNILEPARLGCAIITGPSDDNIADDIALLTQHQAIIQVTDTVQLTRQINRLLQHSDARERLQNNARAIMQQQSRILDCYLQHITGLYTAKGVTMI